MDAGFKTPLLDSFKKGDAERDVRLTAAQGRLAPRAPEQLALLALLARDPDAEIAAAAEATLQSIPSTSVAAVLARSDAPADLVEFFGGRGIAPAATASDDADAPLVDTSGGPEIADEEDDERSALQRLQAMNVPQRLSRASKGTREERAILIRDPNKMIAAAVLSSPKLTESEVEGIAKMASVAEEVLRTIASTRGWMKNYAIASALARNPKTPLAISMHLLGRLNDKDLRTLSTNRNVPDVLRTAARRKVVIIK
jgi:hypothetical protein